MTEQEKQICQNMAEAEKLEVLKTINSEILFRELMVRHLGMMSKLRQIEEIMEEFADETA